MGIKHTATNEEIWEDAYKVYEQVSAHDFKKKYHNIEQYAKYYGVSKSTVSKYVNAVRFDKKYSFDKGTNSVERVYLFSTLQSDYEEFCAYLNFEGIDLESIPDREIKNIIKGFKTKDDFCEANSPIKTGDDSMVFRRHADERMEIILGNSRVVDIRLGDLSKRISDDGKVRIQKAMLVLFKAIEDAAAQDGIKMDVQVMR